MGEAGRGGVQIAIDAELCSRCGLCASVCPTLCLEQKEKSPAVAARLEACVSCGHCVAVCPTGAVNHSGVQAGEPIETTALPEAGALLALFRTRRSIRRFNKQPIRPEHWELMLQAAACSPTAHNAREVRITIVEDPARLREISRCAAEYTARLATLLSNPVVRGLGKILPIAELREGIALIPELLAMREEVKAGGDPVMHHAPGLMVVYAQEGMRFGEPDCTMALQAAALMGQTVGVEGFYLGYVTVVARSDAKMRELLGIPKGYRAQGSIALGYPGVRYRRMIVRKPVPVKRF